jgi:peptidoglycan hydrolase-like protein with peptidoglycan-binding domain
MFLPNNLTLKFGDSGDFVAELQRRLSMLDFFKADAINGFYDGGTVNAVMNFQSMAGLKADGVAGPETLRMLNGAITGDYGETPKGAAAEEEKRRQEAALQQQQKMLLEQQVILQQQQQQQQQAAEAPPVAAYTAPAATPAPLAEPAPTPAPPPAPAAYGAPPAQPYTSPQAAQVTEILAAQAAQQAPAGAAPQAYAPAPKPAAYGAPAANTAPAPAAYGAPPASGTAAPAPAAYGAPPATAENSQAAPAEQPQPRGLASRVAQYANQMIQKLADYFESKLPSHVIQEVKNIGHSMARSGVQEVPIPTGPEQQRSAEQGKGQQQGIQRG